MRYSKELGSWEPRYLKNDRVYVDITKDGLPWDYISFCYLEYKNRTYKSARVLESDKRYVKVLVDGGDLLIIAKRHAKPVLSPKRIMLIEATKQEERFLVEQPLSKLSKQPKKTISIWYLPPLVFLMLVLVGICWR